MRESMSLEPSRDLRLTDVKLTAAALATAGKLVGTEHRRGPQQPGLFPRQDRSA
jgi:hypothetical protein